MASKRSRKTPDHEQSVPGSSILDHLTERDETRQDEQRQTESIAADPVLRQNAPIHCPYCLQACEPKSDALFTTYRCKNPECGMNYTNKVARPRRSQRLGKKPEDDTASAR